MLDAIVCMLDDVGDAQEERRGDSVLLDVEESDGVVSIVTTSGTWVVNKHSVTRQLWLSSPVSGPSKYNYHGDDDATSGGADADGHRWLDERRRRPLRPLLECELSAALAPDEFSLRELNE